MGISNADCRSRHASNMRALVTASCKLRSTKYLSSDSAASFLRDLTLGFARSITFNPKKATGKHPLTHSVNIGACTSPPPDLFGYLNTVPQDMGFRRHPHLKIFRLLQYELCAHLIQNRALLVAQLTSGRELVQLRLCQLLLSLSKSRNEKVESGKWGKPFHRCLLGESLQFPKRGKH